MSLPALPIGAGSLAAPATDQAFDLLDRPFAGPPLDGAALDAALARPIASDPLEDLARPARRVHLVVPDATRAAGTPVLVAAAMRTLLRAGVAAERVGVAFALGLHRPPTAAERRGILGEWDGRLEIVPCEPDRPEDRIDLGATSRGTPIHLGRRALDADLRLLIGSIGFHYFAGFTGGRKAILPGLAAGDSIRANHLRVLGDERAGAEGDAGRDPRVRPGVLDGNPVHLDMEEAAQAALRGPSFLINSATDDGGRVVAVFAGDWREAHRAGCDWVAARRALDIDAPRPLVVASAGGQPKDLNLIQAHKAMEHAQAAVADGGALVLAAACPDGIGHASFLSWMARRADPAAFSRELRARYEVYGQTAYALATKLRRFQIVLISSLPPAQVEAAGLIPARDLEGALVLARSIAGAGRGWWIPHAGSVLVRVS